MKKLCLFMACVGLYNHQLCSEDLGLKALFSAKDSNGITQLMRDAEAGNAQSVSEAIKVGAALDDQNRWKQTPLYYAARSGKEQVVTLLKDAKANLNLADIDNNTPLMIALQAFPVTSAHEAAAGILIGASANVKAINNNKQTALSIAASGGLENIVRKLIAAGADVNAKDAQGRTPLMLVIAADRVGKDKRFIIADMLVNAGTDLTAKDAQGKTALMFAAEQGLTDVATKFIKFKPGLDVNVKDNAGKTALDYAVQSDMINYLKLAGAKSGK